MAVDFYPVADNSAFAVFATGSYCLDSTFEAVEYVFGSACDQFKAFVVVVSANFTLSHDRFLFDV